MSENTSPAFLRIDSEDGIEQLSHADKLAEAGIVKKSRKQKHPTTADDATLYEPAKDFDVPDVRVAVEQITERERQVQLDRVAAKIDKLYE